MIVNYESSASTPISVARSHTKGATNPFSDFFAEKLQALNPQGGNNTSAGVELANVYSEKLQLLNQQRLSTIDALEQEPALSNSLNAKLEMLAATDKEFHYAAADLRISYGKAQMQHGASTDSDGRMQIKTPSDLGRAVSQYADEQRVALWRRTELRSDTVEANIRSGAVGQLQAIELRSQREAEDAADALATQQRIREYRNTLYAQMTGQV